MHIVAEPGGTCHRLSAREDAHSQSFPTAYLSIQTHVGTYVKWRLFISLMNQCHLDTFTAQQIVAEPSCTCHRLSSREEAQTSLKHNVQLLARASCENCNTLQHTAKHCKALQHTATHCSTHIICSSLLWALLEIIDTKSIIICSCLLRALQHTATHCNTLQRTAKHCKALQHTAAHCSTLQHTTTHCNTLQHTHHLLEPPTSTARSHCV